MSAHPESLIREKPRLVGRLLNWLATSDPQRVAAYVEKLRSENPGITNDSLARKIVARKAHRNGLVGAMAGIPGFLASPISIPADLVASCRIQIDMTVCVAYVYGFTYGKTVLKTDAYLILAGNAAKSTLEPLGIGFAKALTKQAVEKYIPRAVMTRTWGGLGLKVVAKSGEMSLSPITRLLPLIGAPIGYAFDWAAAQLVGRIAIRYYSGNDVAPQSGVQGKRG